MARKRARSLQIRRCARKTGLPQNFTLHGTSSEAEIEVVHVPFIKCPLPLQPGCVIFKPGNVAADGRLRDWYFIAEQPAPAPHLAHPEGCAALRIVLVTVPRVSRSCEHFPDGFDLHLLLMYIRKAHRIGEPKQPEPELPREHSFYDTEEEEGCRCTRGYVEDGEGGGVLRELSVRARLRRASRSLRDMRSIPDSKNVTATFFASAVMHRERPATQGAGDVPATASTGAMQAARANVKQVTSEGDRGAFRSGGWRGVLGEVGQVHLPKLGAALQSPVNMVASSSSSMSSANAMSEREGPSKSIELSARFEAHSQACESWPLSV